MLGRVYGPAQAMEWMWIGDVSPISDKSLYCDYYNNLLYQGVPSNSKTNKQ